MSMAAVVAGVAGLDVLFGWSPAFSLPLKIASLIVMLAGYALASYALMSTLYLLLTPRQE